MTAEQIAADDDAACRNKGLKRETPAYVKCREDIKNQRAMSDMVARIGMQNDMWAMQQMSTRAMMGH